MNLLYTQESRIFFFLKKNQRRVNSHNSKVKRNIIKIYSLLLLAMEMFVWSDGFQKGKNKKFYKVGLNLQEFILFVVVSFDIHV